MALTEQEELELLELESESELEKQKQDSQRDQDWSDTGATVSAQEAIADSMPKDGKFMAWLRKHGANTGLPMLADAATGKKPLEPMVPEAADFLTMIPRGQSYGLVDEIGGLGAGYLSGLKRDLMSGPGLADERGFDTEAYMDQRNMLRKEAEQARERSPNAALIGEVLGGFLTPGPKGTGVKGGAKAGALGGAIAGAGSADSSTSRDPLEIGEKLKGLMAGGILGGVAGGALGGATDFLGDWFQKSASINALRSLGISPSELVEKFPELKKMTAKEVDVWTRQLSKKLSDQGVVRFGKGAEDASEVLGDMLSTPPDDARTLAGFGDSSVFGGDVPTPISKPKFTDAPDPEQEAIIQKLMNDLLEDGSTPSILDVPEYQPLVSEVPTMKMPEQMQTPGFDIGQGNLSLNESPFIDPKMLKTLRETSTKASLSEFDRASLLGSFGPLGDVVEFATLSPIKKLAQQVGLNPPGANSRAAATASSIQRPMSDALLSETTDYLTSTAPRSSLAKLSQYLFGSTDTKSLQEAKKVQEEEAIKNYALQGRDGGVGLDAGVGE